MNFQKLIQHLLVGKIFCSPLAIIYFQLILIFSDEIGDKYLFFRWNLSITIIWFYLKLNAL
jgi:hypothetical protein